MMNTILKFAAVGFVLLIAANIEAPVEKRYKNGKLKPQRFGGRKLTKLEQAFEDGRNY